MRSRMMVTRVAVVVVGFVVTVAGGGAGRGFPAASFRSVSIGKA